LNPCIPTRGTKVPAGPDWLHEIKHDGYRLIVQREGKRVRLFTRNGYDWRDRYPPITEAALRNRNTSFVIDGEAVLLGVNGISDLDGLHSRKHDDEVQLRLRLSGQRRRGHPQVAAGMRKANIPPPGSSVEGTSPAISNRARFPGPGACTLEGWSQHRERPSCRTFTPLAQGQNPNHPAMSRVKAGDDPWTDEEIGALGRPYGHANRKPYTARIRQYAARQKSCATKFVGS
jgi:bifunctional non-homologous end joining protein LigD